MEPICAWCLVNRTPETLRAWQATLLMSENPNAERQDRKLGFGTCRLNKRPLLLVQSILRCVHLSKANSPCRCQHERHFNSFPPSPLSLSSALYQLYQHLAPCIPTSISLRNLRGLSPIKVFYVLMQMNLACIRLSMLHYSTRTNRFMYDLYVLKARTRSYLDIPSTISSVPLYFFFCIFYGKLMAKRSAL